MVAYITPLKTSRLPSHYFYIFGMVGNMLFLIQVGNAVSLGIELQSSTYRLTRDLLSWQLGD